MLLVIASALYFFVVVALGNNPQLFIYLYIYVFKNQVIIYRETIDFCHFISILVS